VHVHASIAVNCIDLPSVAAVAAAAAAAAAAVTKLITQIQLQFVIAFLN